MKFELDLTRSAPAEALPDGVTPLGPTKQAIGVETRRDVRMATDDLIHEALRANQLPPLVDGVCKVMHDLAVALHKLKLEPDVPHFIEAAVALVEDARTVFDAGVRVDDPEKTMIGAVMLEITARGVFAALSIDYEAQMKKRYASPAEPDAPISHVPV